MKVIKTGVCSEVLHETQNTSNWNKSDILFYANQVSLLG